MLHSTACNIYNVVMPLVRHTATSQKYYNIILVTKHTKTIVSSCEVATIFNT